MYSMCVATIVDVIGDRLRMRYDGLDDDVAEDFWCHYQSSEIHPIGWSSLVGHTLQPPIGKVVVWSNYFGHICCVKTCRKFLSPICYSTCLVGWKHSLSKWNEFLADDLANSLDAPQEFFVQVCIVLCNDCFDTYIKSHKTFHVLSSKQKPLKLRELKNAVLKFTSLRDEDCSSLAFIRMVTR